MGVLLSLLLLVLLVAAIVDVIRIEQWRIRYLDRVFWLIVVILLPLLGPIVWFVVGRNYSQPVDAAPAQQRPVQPERPAPTVPSEAHLSKTERELAALEREIIAHENADRIRRLEAELRERRGGDETAG